MEMRKYIVILLFFFLPLAVFAQADMLKFKQTTHDFGTIKEEKGVVAHTFIFQNLAKVPVIIKSVQTTCGCTTPIWTKKPVLPKKKGIIKVTYNPMNRPNKFVKTITVTTNLGKKQLTIIGNVTPRPKSLAEIYPKKMGELRLKTSYVMFDKIANMQKKTMKVQVVNDSRNSISIAFDKVPNYVTLKASKNILKPKEKGEIEVTYDAQKTKQWGFHSDLIKVLVNGQAKVSNNLVVTATIVDDFSKMSKRALKKAPKIGVDKLERNFQSVVAGDKVKTIFKIVNVGESSLIIHNVDRSSETLRVKLSKKIIAPNTSASLEVILDTRGKKGYQNEQVTLITNSPDFPILDFKVNGFVN